jgi:prolycopene isomerase
MGMRRESKAEAYDVVVIGSGMGGLTCAAALARRGRHVLVVERHDRAGGYAHGFQRGKRHFDSAVHMTGGAGRGTLGGSGLIAELLPRLGVSDECNFIPLEEMYSAVFPDTAFQAPAGMLEFIDAHAQLFPSERRGFKEFVRLAVKFNEEHTQVDETGDAATFDPDRFPNLAKYQDATLEDVLSEHVKDARARTLFTALWPYQGLPPSKLGAIQFGLLLASFLNTGVFYCEGTFQNLPNALVKAIEADGSEILLRTTVRRITLRDGKVAGVVLENGQRISAPVVVSNADAIQTFDELVGAEHLPAEHRERVRRLRPSLSALSTYIATDLDLVNHPSAAHSIFWFDSWDYDDVYQGMREGRPSHLSIAIPTLVDPTLAPEGEHVMSVVMLLPYDLAASWREEKERFHEALLRQLEVVIPGINDHLLLAEGASPRTMERYTLNHLGALYGWEASPGDEGVHRLSHRTPIDGLFLSGHWTRPGGGLVPVMVSGMQTAQIVLGDSSVREVVESLGERT